MTSTSTQATPGTSVLPPTTRLGHVHLTVNRLDRQIQFYTEVLNFHLHWRDGAEAALGTASEVLLRLSEDPAAHRVQHTTGMYHFAILYPNRKELARAIGRLFALRYPNAPTDHGMSKTTYLDDPEGNTIELYIRSLEDGRLEVMNGQLVVHHADGRISDGRAPLDLEVLFRELDETERLDVTLPQGTQIGHMHLYVSSLNASMKFYTTMLGFQEGPMFKNFRMGEVGLDVHQPHVIAFNTWKGEGIPPTPSNALGIRYFTIVVPTAGELERLIAHVQAAGVPTERTPEGVLVRDPAHINIILTDHMHAIK